MENKEVNESQGATCLEDELLVARRGALKTLLDEARAVLVASELGKVTHELLVSEKNEFVR